MNILCQFPTRSRPVKFISVMTKYLTFAENLKKIWFNVVIDEDDQTMNNEQMKAEINKMPPCISVSVGKSKNKVDAINRMPKDRAWDIVLLISDDMMPKAQGWDDIIKLDMKKYYPDTDGVLWYNDGFVGKRLNTLSILGKKYYDRFGYIYHPDYKSLWCDNEFMLVADMLNKQTYIEDCIIRHEHAIHMKQNPDALLKHTESFCKIDKETFERRRAMGFEI